jgi:hypothetical protein
MWGVVCALALVALPAAEPAGEPLQVEVQRWGGELILRVELSGVPVKDFPADVSSGAPAEIDYLIRVYSHRKLFPDRRVWKAIAEASVTFDAITGRYICQLIVNEDTVASREVETPQAARDWLRAPPPMEVVLPEPRQDDFIRVRVRAVFERGTSWLIFPTTEGTDWVEVQLNPPARDAVK